MNGISIFFARFISIVAAIAVTVGVTLYPRAIALDMHSVPHGWLVCLLMGMSAAYVYGFGFVPQHPILKIIFSPIVAWPLIAIGTIQIFF